MGKVNRLRHRIEPFAALFWALTLYSPIYYTTGDPARRPCIPQLYGSVRLWKVGLNLTEEAFQS